MFFHVQGNDMHRIIEKILNNDIILENQLEFRNKLLNQWDDITIAFPFNILEIKL